MASARFDLPKERRRSVRVPRRVPLTLSHGLDSCNARSVVISANGALVKSNAPFLENTAVLVINNALGIWAEAWVISARPAAEPGRFAIALGFTEAAPVFWGKDYSQGLDPLP